MKLLYYIAAIGLPDLNIKIDILLYNLKYIYNDININFDIIINCYEENDNNIKIIINSIKQLNIINNIYLYKKKGVLTELFLTNPNNNLIKNYEYILFMLDDVKIINLNIKHFIQLKNLYNIKIASPKIISSTHSFMNIHDNITIHNFLEIYCLILTPDELNKFFSIHTIENKWMWGVDFLFGHYNIRAGVINNYSVQHVLPSKSNKGEANHLMNEYLSKTPYKWLDELWKTYTPIYEYIKI